MKSYTSIDEQDQSTFPQYYKPVYYYYYSGILGVKEKTIKGPIKGYYHEDGHWLVYENPETESDPVKWYRAVMWRYSDDTYQNDYDTVREKLTDRDLYELLAEELCEASQASLKYIRAAKMNNNTTPVTKEQAFLDLVEELGDVAMIIDLIKLPIPNSKTNSKWSRWSKRLTKQS